MLTHGVITVGLLRASCIFSIFGSAIVMAVCSYSQIVDKQKGKQLIFWLSVADFGSSVVYFMSSFEKSDKNSSMCQAFALLGIFFPVASFLWTDFIAYYLWTMIVSRRIRSNDEWNIMMKYFHIVSWGLSLVCIVLVGATGHAGRGKSGDSDNTGGWCWVQAADNSRLIIWELVGGKLIEWISCVIILPFFYYKTARMLMKLDTTWSSFVREEREASQLSFWRAPCGYCTKLFSVLIHPSHEMQPPSVRVNQPSSSFTFESQSVNTKISAVGKDGVEHVVADTSTDSQMNKPKFWKFYSRMALVPILFFLARIWGSLRILIYAFSRDNAVATASADGWLHTMQAIFDPSQGFLNALLFVFLSSKNMTALGKIISSSRWYIGFRKVTAVEWILGKYNPSQKVEALKVGNSESDVSESSALVSALGVEEAMTRSLLRGYEDQSDYDSYYSDRPSLTSG